MRDVSVTVVGNVGADPVVRETTRGRVTNFTLGATRRTWDRRTEAWVDGPTTWYRVACWNQLGANVAESLRRGERVLVAGRLQIASYQDRDGVERVRAEVQADHVGHELTFGITRFTRVLRSASLLGGTAAGPDGEGLVGDGAAGPAVGWQQAPGSEDGRVVRTADLRQGLDELDDELDDDELDDMDELDVADALDGEDGGLGCYEEAVGAGVTTGAGPDTDSSRDSRTEVLPVAAG